MKTLLRIFLLVLAIGSAFSACKKKDSAEEIDLRTQYVGTYDPVKYSANTTLSYSTGDSPYSHDESQGTLTVAKGTGAIDEFFITIQFPAYTEQLTAKLSGTKFTITSKQKEVLAFGSNNYNADYTGYGEFTTDNKIIYQFTTQTTQGGLTIKKIGSFTGPKK